MAIGLGISLLEKKKEENGGSLIRETVKSGGAIKRDLNGYHSYLYPFSRIELAIFLPHTETNRPREDRMPRP